MSGMLSSKYNSNLSQASGMDHHTRLRMVPVGPYKLRRVISLVEIAISNNPKPTIYRSVYDNTAPVDLELIAS